MMRLGTVSILHQKLELSLQHTTRADDNSRWITFPASNGNSVLTMQDNPRLVRYATWGLISRLASMRERYMTSAPHALMFRDCTEFGTLFNSVGITRLHRVFWASIHLTVFQKESTTSPHNFVLGHGITCFEDSRQS